MFIVGIDLAWGEKKSDGVCCIEANRFRAKVRGYAYPQGDEALLGFLRPLIQRERELFITVDAPLVCPNHTGTRPVDRLTHRMFHREHAACHPANLTKCPRPPRILEKLQGLGMEVGWQTGRGVKTVAEVYPHPAMVRLFELPRIVKYKKGTVKERKQEFRRLQRLMKKLLAQKFPSLEVDSVTRALLGKPWTKPVEDQTDALFCALIGLWHWRYHGKRSEIIGDVATGFILLPRDARVKS
jgi:predicted RNase H-like nuclease